MPKKIVAEELTDATIDFVSVVGKGANKRAFKILKSEDMQETPTIGEKLQSLFLGKQTPANVTAVIVAKDAVEVAKPIIIASGLSVDDVLETESGVIIFKQECFDLESEGSMIALSGDVLVSFDRVIKQFESYSTSESFDETLAAGSFYPGMGIALESFGHTVYNIMANCKNPGDASEKMSKALDGLKSHMVTMVNNLPSTVFKMDASFNSGDADMNLVQRLATAPKLDEVMGGDLDGLTDAVVVKAEVAPVVVAPVVADPVVAEPVLAEVVKAEEPVVVAPVVAEAAPQDAMLLLLKSMNESILATNELLKIQAARIDAVEQTAAAAVVKADRPVVSSHYIQNEQLATLRGHKSVVKHDVSAPDDVWAGMMPEFDNLR